MEEQVEPYLIGHKTDSAPGKMLLQHVTQFLKQLPEHMYLPVNRIRLRLYSI